MKTLILTFIMTLAFTHDTLSQNDSTGVRETFEKIIQLSQEQSPADLAPYILYRGPDTTRNGKDVCNYSNEDEKEEVENIAFKFKGWNATSYKVKDYKTQKKSNGNVLHGLFLEYSLNGETKKMIVAFQKLGDKFVVIDID